MAPQWRIVMGCDEAGLSYKNKIKADFEADPRVISVVDVGSGAPDDKTPYPTRAAAAARIVKGIRAVTAHDSFSVERSVKSNNAQVLCFGERVVGIELARKLAKEWLDHEFDPASASAKKVEEICQLEEEA
uniref:Ribose-5-phosphate isomerase n=1 Tax=Bionectria ochroleuca TaxID=29856 RepID=A0A0B7KQ90_BIOOC